LEVPRVEVRFRNLNVSTEVHVGRRALPTLVNYVHDVAEVHALCKVYFCMWFISVVHACGAFAWVDRPEGGGG
jgi:hypothetical protein